MKVLSRARASLVESGLWMNGEKRWGARFDGSKSFLIFLARAYPKGVYTGGGLPLLVTVVETAAYLSAAKGLMSEGERAAIVDWIAKSPQAGDLIPDSGGLRKVRIPLQGRGKRGGGRIITFFVDEGMPVFLITVYAKNVQTDLDIQQRRAARAVTDAIRAQYHRR